jgi:hypothetical protein
VKRVKDKIGSRCECDQDSRNNPNPRSAYFKEEFKAMKHAPGKCRGDYLLRLFDRGGKRLTLCSCCNQLGDRLVTGDL